MVELKLALQENAIVREPLIPSSVEKQQVGDVRHPLRRSPLHTQLLELYRLFVINSEVPTDFPTILQIREMFNLSGAEADRLEREVSSAAMFSI